MWNRKDLKMKAKALVKPNYWKVVFASLVMMIAGGAGGAAGGRSASEEIQSPELSAQIAALDGESLVALLLMVLTACLVVVLISTAVSIFVMNPLMVGAQRLFVNCKEDKANYADVASGFNHSYLNTVKIMFLQNLFIFLWSCLFIIPGIIKAYEYRMVIYILAENPGISSKEAFARSREMMKGQKWNAFVLDLSFLGWHILGACTCGIAELFYVMPYNLLANAELYHTLKTQQ